MKKTTIQNGYFKSLIFLLGFSQFFVLFEPGPSEIVFLLLIPIITKSSLVHPIFLTLLSGNIISLCLEALIFNTFSWSMISIYLTFLFAVVYSIFQKYKFDGFQIFAIGGCIASAITLALIFTPYQEELYRSGIRFTGLFKDPNVTAPTSLWFALTALLLKGKRKLFAIPPTIVFALALSRATFLAFPSGILLAYSMSHSLYIIAALLVVAIAILFQEGLIAFINGFFSAIGRGEIINNYDEGRMGNWMEIFNNWLTSVFPLGPTYSDINDFSTHSTILRLLTEQGILSLILFLIAVFYSIKTAKPRLITIAHFTLLTNSLVIDATHWRILFISFAVSVSIKHVFSEEIQRKSHKH